MDKIFQDFFLNNTFFNYYFSVCNQEIRLQSSLWVCEMQNAKCPVSPKNWGGGGISIHPYSISIQF